MIRSRRMISWGLALSLALPLTLGSAACGGPKESEVARSQVKAGDMPTGGEWTGVYYSELYGYLHMVKEGKTISGKWRTTNGDAWGELHGEVIGDLLRFEWKEHKIGMVGASASSSGKGYFKYTRPEGENVDDRIEGEWGLGASDAGNKWEAVRQRNMQPDPDSVAPDEYEAPETGGGWDETEKPAGGGGGDDGDEGEGGEDEAPPPPPI